MFQIESLLFVSSKPMKIGKLAKALDVEESLVIDALERLQNAYNNRKQGFILVNHNNEYKLATHPDNATLIENYIQDEINIELSKPSLETLTIIAYRGPISKYELELIRGVNCSMILRNLMIKGLVKIEKDKETQGDNYVVTMEFVKYLGLEKMSDLPDYEKLSSHDIIERLLNETPDN